MGTRGFNYELDDLVKYSFGWKGRRLGFVTNFCRRLKVKALKIDDPKAARSYRDGKSKDFLEILNLNVLAVKVV